MTKQQKEDLIGSVFIFGGVILLFGVIIKISPDLSKI